MTNTLALGLNDGLLRVLKIGGVGGPEWWAANGFGQDCAMSVKRISALMRVWLQRQSERVIPRNISVYIDDSNLWIIVESLRQVLGKLTMSFQETAKVDKLSGQLVHLGKAQIYSTSLDMDKLI